MLAGLLLPAIEMIGLAMSYLPALPARRCLQIVISTVVECQRSKSEAEKAWGERTQDGIFNKPLPLKFQLDHMSATMAQAPRGSTGQPWAILGRIATSCNTSHRWSDFTSDLAVITDRDVFALYALAGSG